MIVPEKIDDFEALLGELEGLLTALVRVDTCNPPGNEANLIPVIENYLRGHGATDRHFTTLNHGDNRASLVVTVPGHATATGSTAGQMIGFAAHLDTVPIGEAETWSTDPFGAVLHNGRLYGRGAADMKGGLAAILTICAWYLAHTPPLGLRFIFTADEEFGGMGMKAVCSAGIMENLGFLVVAEPTNNRPALCEKGVAWFRYTFSGKTSHGSMPGEGVNALMLGFEFLKAATALVETACPAHPMLGANTFAVTTGHGGVKTNVIPDRAEFMVDCRLLPGASPIVETGLDKLEKDFTAAHPGFGIHRQPTLNMEAIEVSAAHPAVAKLAELSGQGPFGVFYFTDGAEVLSAYPDMPFTIIGPGAPGECHTPNESVELAQLADAARLYRCFIEAAGPFLL
jgi:succinyl-diaminopimelate desuccinylase